MKTEKYLEQQNKLPKKGKYIIGEFDEETITVYQAFNEKIANFAVANQKFGGNHYSFTRMTWIKPNFMWMMYRSGWATKPNQEQILAVKIKRDGFEEILLQAVKSSYDERIFGSEENWRKQLQNSTVRLQWDPDHSPTGEKLERKAIQLGLKGEILEKFNKEWIVSITGITDFVKQESLQKENPNVPIERVLEFKNEEAIAKQIGMNIYA
ncbi:DUF4291 domain-containing protein [Aureivirga sp. CE67]|uniref:DUF4291 domain-containing protein n=1 Tax=Aureivirga sp. CE67 TaxID=1788983 RepID=UPI0018CACC97|nr:DUF4291 domain-containing protein [Aureivirga sp. CE67]